MLFETYPTVNGERSHEPALVATVRLFRAFDDVYQALVEDRRFYLVLREPPTNWEVADQPGNTDRGYSFHIDWDGIGDPLSMACDVATLAHVRPVLRALPPWVLDGRDPDDVSLAAKPAGDVLT